MARTQARLLCSIWSDKDFLALTADAQRLYMFLLSQPNLSHAGLLPLTVKRWANMASDTVVDGIETDLAELEASTFVVLDRDTEELLLRTLVRNDGIWKQPKMMLAMKADAGEIMSARLKAVLRSELARIDVNPIPKAETREAITDVIASLMATLPDTPTEANPIPLDTPIANPHAGARAPSSTSTTVSTTTSATAIAPTRPTRDRDEIWDALLEACQVDPNGIPESARGAYNRAVKDLKAIGSVTPGEIRKRAAIFRGQWREASLTPTALVRRWAECERPSEVGVAPSRNTQILDAAMERAIAAERKAIG